jgi:hypothetical protein
MSRRAPHIFLLVLIMIGGCAAQLVAENCKQPTVTFNSGQLAVTSSGCSLQQVLAAVVAQTGARINVPPAAGADPTYGTFGPGDPARVVSELLDGVPFNRSVVTKADGSGSLVEVVLTERKPPVIPTKSAAATAKDELKEAHEKKKREEAALVASAGYDAPAEQRKPRVELDEATLKKLPPLPAGIPTSVWQLYPEIVANGGVIPTPPPTSSITPQATAGANGVPFWTPPPPDPPVQKGAIGLPPLPAGIDPGIGSLYPWNLMQLIASPPQPPAHPFIPPPMMPLIPWHP